MDIFVIIVTYNGMHWYDHCFSSLRNSTVSVNTIVIDNASSDNTVDYIRSKYPEIICIENKENQGFGKANNIGIRYALEHNCDYVFLLNQDAWIEPNTIAALIKLSALYPEFGILSPMHCNKSMSAIEDGLQHYLADWRITDRALLSDCFFNHIKEIYETKYVNAAAWLLPRNTLETIGGFDPIFLHYGEDDNYLQRVQYHGLKVGICPNCHIVHDTELSGKQTNRMQTVNCYRLTQYVDINLDYSYFKYQCYYMRKLVVHLFSGHMEQVKKVEKDIVYIFKMNKLILNSRNSNRQIGRNYL